MKVISKIMIGILRKIEPFDYYIKEDEDEGDFS